MIPETLLTTEPAYSMKCYYAKVKIAQSIGFLTEIFRDRGDPSMKLMPGMTLIISLSGCATIVNDAYIPLTVTFSDGSEGECTFKNKRGKWSSQIPTSSVMIRRSDDSLEYVCTTEEGKEATGSIRSEMEGGKLAASVVFFDFGITDSITDKHRTYQGNVVIPVSARGTVLGKVPEPAQESHSVEDPE